MKNYIIGVLAVIILVLASLLYRQDMTSMPRKFPILEKPMENGAEAPLLLYVIFQKNNCPDCLEFIRVLNRLPSHFIVRGIVPAKDLKEEKELRRLTGAGFPLMSAAKYKKYVHGYTPVLIGVSPVDGEILFTLPGVPGEKEYLQNYLESLYNKLWPSFINEQPRR